MKNNKILKMLLILLANILAVHIKVRAQDSKFGSDLSPRGTIRVLVVFAEVPTACEVASNIDPGWPTGTAVPTNAHLYLDAAISSTPVSKLTKYYKDVSLGELNVIGDYFDRTVQVPCSLANASGAIIQLQTELNLAGITTTKNGYSISDFDLWTTAGQGIQKPNMPDNNVDVTVIIWRNTGYSCGSGLGVDNYMFQTLLGKHVTLYGTWGGCPSNWQTSYDGFFVAEFFHSLLGGNNFHTGGGAADGTFMFGATGSYSTSAQSQSVSNIVCGWDRNYLDWRGVGASQRQYPISALNIAGQEVVSDITVITNPASSFFILRDFVTVGDAVRVKLPHFNWQTNGDRKNQYLWIENHQVAKPSASEFDHNKEYGNCGSWTAGIYVQLQAGKDFISGPNTYYGSYSSPNELNDWLFPLHKEGNWDYFYSYSDKNILPNINCGWSGKSLPYSIKYPNGTVLSNPFTGYNDVYGYVDSDQSGIFDAGDIWVPRYQKWLGTPVVGSPPLPVLPQWGDNLDGFTGINTKISIATNPAPMPVYTLTEGVTGTGTIASYENRTICLNNISITIIDDDYYNVGTSGKNAYLIRVDWDENTIDDNVRWCGNIVLENDMDDPGMRTMQIDLTPGKTLTLDRGLSPTKIPTIVGQTFTDPTYLHLLSVICIEPGANIIFQDPATSKIVINGVSYFDYFNL